VRFARSSLANGSVAAVTPAVKASAANNQAAHALGTGAQEIVLTE
jgi:hypothetical protein